MNRLLLPKNWTIYETKPSWRFNKFGYCWKSQKRIEIYPPIWVPTWFGMRRWWINMTVNHELGHAWGVIGCNRPWCRMFEAMAWKPTWKDVWWEKVLAGFFGIFNGFRMCKKHRIEVEGRIEDVR